MFLDQTKAERQQELAIQWRDGKGKGGIQAPPGFGKTFLTLNYICKPMLEKAAVSGSPCKFLVVVHSDDLRSTWRNAVKKFLSNYEDKFIIDTIQAYQRRRRTYQVSLIVLDEVDEYFSEDRSNIWNGTWVRFNFLLWLSATPRDNQKRDSAFFSSYPRLGYVPVEEAIQKKWIDSFRIINIPIPFTDEEREEYVANEEKVFDYLNRFDNELETVYNCAGGHATKDGYVSWFSYSEAVARRNGWKPEFDEYMQCGFPADMSKELCDHITDIQRNWNPRTIKNYAEQCIKAVEKRSDLLWNAENKRLKVLELCKEHEGIPKIVFSMRINFIEVCAKMLHQEHLKCTLYHSSLVSRPLRYDENGKLSLFGTGEYHVYKTGKNAGQPKVIGADTIKKMSLQHFADGDVDTLLVCSGIDKGSDFPATKVAIIAANAKNANQFIQRLGRATRKHGDDETIIYNLYIPGTREERNLKIQLKELPSIEVTWEPITWDEILPNEEDLFKLF